MPTSTGPEGVDVDAVGNLYVASFTAPSVTIYNAPLSGTSTVSVTITTGLTKPIGVKLDSAGKLYVADNTNNYVAIYTPPFTNASAPSVTVPVTNAWGISLDSAGNLWTVARSLMQVQKFTPPFTNTSTPVLTISTGLLAPRYPALDQSGNPYVSDNATAVRVFLAPLSMTSAPAFSFTTPASNGIRFGP